MSRFFSRFDKSYFILLPSVLYATWPWFSYRVRPFVPFALFLLWLMFQRKANRYVYQGRRFSQIFMITVIFFVFHSYLRNVFALFGHGQFAFWHEYATTLSAISHFIIVYLSLKFAKFRELEFLTIVALIGTSLSGIAAIRGGMLEGFEGGRLLTTSVEALDAAGKFGDGLLAYQIGAANYKSTYSFAIFIIPLLWAVFNVKNSKVRSLLVIAVCACVLIVKNSGLGTPVFILLWGSALILSAILGFKSMGIKIIGTTAIILLINFAYHPKMFSPLAEGVRMLGRVFPEGSSIQMRCESVADAFMGDQDAYAINRYQLQKRSLETFFEHPLFGAGIYNSPHPKAYDVGGHSCLLDRLGQAGTIGGFFYFGFIVSLYFYYKQMLVSFGFPRQWLLAPLVVLFTYVFACVANPLPTFPEIIYYIPGLMLLAMKYGSRKPLKADFINNGMYMV